MYFHLFKLLHNCIIKIDIIAYFIPLLLISFFSFVPSAGTFTSLVQILNYTSLLGDFFGRQLVLLRRERFLIIRNSEGVLVSVLLRCILTVGTFGYYQTVKNFMMADRHHEVLYCLILTKEVELL